MHMGIPFVSSLPSHHASHSFSFASNTSNTRKLFCTIIVYFHPFTTCNARTKISNSCSSSSVLVFLLCFFLHKLFALVAYSSYVTFFCIEFVFPFYLSFWDSKNLLFFRIFLVNAPMTFFFTPIRPLWKKTMPSHANDWNNTLWMIAQSIGSNSRQMSWKSLWTAFFTV